MRYAKSNQIKDKVEITKFLGVGLLIDNNLSWEAHTMHISKIGPKYNGIIRKIRPFLNKDSLLILYNTLVLSYLLLHPCLGR